MKNLLILVLALIFSASYGQQNKNERTERGHHKQEMRQKNNNLSPEQRAELSSKKMSLQLDLSEAQQKEVYLVALEQAKLRETRFKNRKNKTELTDEERFKLQSDRLDHQIAIRDKMKSILTEKQYDIWQKTDHFRKKEKQRRQKRDNMCSVKR